MENMSGATVATTAGKQYAVPMNTQTGCFEVHAQGCKDLKNPRKRADFNLNPYGKQMPQTVVAATAGEAARAALVDEFSSDSEHPATDGFPGGSYGAAGFTVRTMPCARKA